MKIPQETKFQTLQFFVWFGMIVVLTLLDRLGNGWIIRWAEGIVFVGAVVFAVVSSTRHKRSSWTRR